MTAQTTTILPELTYKDYTTPTNEPIKDFCTTNFEESEQIARLFFGEKELGLDCEWAWKDGASKTALDVENDREELVEVGGMIKHIYIN